MNKTIYFTGSLPRKGVAPFGGGEVGNSRTITLLRSFGYRVITVRKSRSNSKDSWFRSRLEYPFRFLSNAVKWFVVLLCGSRKNGIAHVSGFYGKTIYLETFQVLVAKLLGYRVVYEMRGGGAQAFYEKGSRLYRKQFEAILNKSDFLLSQGLENKPLLNSLCSTPVYHYPNFVQEGFYPEVLPDKPNDSINLLYFGRIEEKKNPLLIVDIASLLQKRYDNITLMMLGDGPEELMERIQRHMNESLRPGSYHLLSGCTHDKLPELLWNKHFYLFPSRQEREGQSNAVTEAMSFGIIPIASPQGFNRSTIGDDYLVVYDLSADAYAERICNIIDKGKMDYYSSFVRQRFINHFTGKEVSELIKKEYEVFFL